MKKNNYGEFVRIFGVSPRNIILEFLLELRDLDFSIGDIAKETGLNRATTYNVMETLIKEIYVIPTRKVSGSQLYKLNTKKEEVQKLIKIFVLVLDKITNKYENKKQIEVPETFLKIN